MFKWSVQMVSSKNMKIYDKIQILLFGNIMQYIAYFNCIDMNIQLYAQKLIIINKILNLHYKCSNGWFKKYHV